MMLTSFLCGQGLICPMMKFQVLIANIYVKIINEITNMTIPNLSSIISYFILQHPPWPVSHS